MNITHIDEHPIREQSLFKDLSKRTRWEWLVGLGTLLALFGIIMIAAPVTTSVQLAWLMGILFVASGVAQLVHAFRTTQTKGSVGRFILSVLSLIAGILTMRNPLAGTMGITLVLAFYLFVAAVGKWALSAELRPQKGWGLIFFSALCSFLLGVLLIVTFPASSLVAPAIFLGVDLIFYGSMLIGLAMAFWRAERAPRISQTRKVA